jgi:hypothetical protein
VLQYNHEVQDVQANADGGAENALAAVLLLWSMADNAGL